MAVEIIAPIGSAVAVSTAWNAIALSAAHAVEVTADVSVMPTYRGAYSFTPSSTVQRIRCDGLMMDGDVWIAPIPSNYGLVTWDGSTITVS